MGKYNRIMLKLSGEALAKDGGYNEDEIETDEELEEASDAFDELLDSEEFDEMFDDEDDN